MKPEKFFNKKNKQENDPFKLKFGFDDIEQNNTLNETQILENKDNIVEDRNFLIFKNIIFGLKKPVLKITKELKNFIDQNYYQVLLGDDASGRVLTLIFREIINQRRKMLGQENIITKFIGGGRSYS
ncbi:MAG: hypothetical protein ACP5H7_02690 [Minisyncoccia bacterium]